MLKRFLKDWAAPRKNKQTNKQNQATQEKWGRDSVSLKVLYSNDGH